MRIARHTLMLVAVGALLAGCSSGTTTDAESPAPTSGAEVATTTMPTPTPTVAATTPPPATPAPMPTTEAPATSMPEPTATTPSAETAPAEAATITIQDFDFAVPATVSPGASIDITNADGVLHTVTAEDDAFDLRVPDGDTVTLTAPTTPGEYAFFCELHSNMAATLVVG